MMEVSKILAVVLCLLFFSTTARADDDAGAVARRMDILNAQLSLDGNQTQKLEHILSSLSRQNRASRPGKGEGRSERERGSAAPDSMQFEKRAERLHASVEALLSQEQIARYQKLVETENEWWLDPQLLQMDGMLTLSHDQCQKIYPVLRRSRLRLRALRESARATGDRGAIDQLRKEMKESNEVVLEFLDENQQKLWKDHIEALRQEREKMRPQHPEGMRGGNHGMGGMGG
jgi:hypothetical protein